MKNQSLDSKTWLRYAGIALAVPFGAIFLVESIVFKAVQVTTAMGGFSLPPVFQAVAPDAAFAVFMTFVASVLFSHRAKKVRIISAVVYYVVMTYALIISAFSNGYFLATGSNLSSSTIEYWFQNMGISTEIIASEAASWRLIVLGGQILLIAACIVVPRLGKVQNWIGKKGDIRSKKAKLAAVVCASLFAIFLIIPPAEGRAMAMSRCIPISIIEGFISDTFLLSGDVELADNERIGGVLEFDKDPNAPRPNIVFIIFESLNWKSSDLYVPGLGTTPFLAKLAEKGMVIENDYAIVPHTTKALAPILCGIYPSLKTKPLETTPGILPRRCLGHILAEQGYRSAFFQPAYAFEKRNQLVANLGIEVFKGVKEMPRAGFEKVSYFGSEDKVMVKPSMEWVDSVKDSGPFFLTYLTLSTHHNYITPQTFPYVDFKKEDKDWNNYLNAVRYIDDTIREIFEEFEKRGLLENTVFFMMGDHGEGFAEHGRRQHDLVLWEEGIRSAAMMYGPSFLPQGERVKGIRSNFDFVPTVCDILGLELKKGSFLGQSMLKPVPEDRQIFHSCWFKRECLAVHDGPIKTIYHYGSQSMEVYDNFKDPYEKTNLAHQGPYTQGYLETKKQEMLRWKKTVDQQYADWERALTEDKVTDKEPPVATRLAARFGDAIELIGYEAPSRVVAGQDIRVKYVFKSIGKLTSFDKLFVHVTYNNGMVNGDHVPVNGTHPLEKWKPGQYIVDEHTIHIPGNWTSGDVKVYLGFWNKKTRSRLSIKDTEATVDRSRLLVTELQVEGQQRTTKTSRAEIRNKIKDWTGFEEPSYEKKIGAVFGDTAELVGVSLDRMDVMLAGTVEMTYVFRALKNIPRNWRLTVRLEKNDGFQIKGDHAPISGLYPPKDWREGEYVVDKHKIHIDMYRSKTGTYTAWLGFRDGKKPVPVSGEGEFDSSHRVKLGTVTISPKDARQ
ncbi:MAG: sulfatase-like hydrolase/transferase [Deltaproteobacteria bacterium]|nr:sulfatase-like hydrolase/transferase [Deltaproteobacteria bacterium]